MIPKIGYRFSDKIMLNQSCDGKIGSRRRLREGLALLRRYSGTPPAADPESIRRSGTTPAQTAIFTGIMDSGFAPSVRRNDCLRWRGVTPHDRKFA